MIKTNADQWCNEKLLEYEIAAKELDYLKDTPKPESASDIIWSARVKRAERIYEEKAPLASIALAIRDLRQNFQEGNVIIDVPGLQVKIKWMPNT